MSAVAALALAGCPGLKKNNTDPAPPPPPNTAPTNVTVPPTSIVTAPPTTVPVAGCDDPQLLVDAQNVIGNACETCHGPNSPKYNGFGDALDPVAMVADGWVTPGNPDTSKIYIQISPGLNGEPPNMPNAQGGGPLLASEIGIVKQWITCGAADWTQVGGTTTPGGGGGNPSARGFITPEMEFLAAQNDLGGLLSVSPSQSIPDKVNARYISLVNLYNAGVPADRIKLFAQGVNKIMWNLTNERSPANLVPVDMDGLALPFNGGTISVSEGLGQTLMWRVDEKNWQWDAVSQNADHDVWEEMLKAYPYGIQYDNTFDEALEVVTETHSRVPIIKADWFSDRPTVDPLYFDILDIPNDFDQYYDQFGGINEQELFDSADIDCAGMDGNATLVSNFNRVQCRFDSINGYCWNSSDFASSSGAKNIFANPLGFLQERAGGEAFCSLPDGQQSYFLFANLVAQGQGNIRLADAPTNIIGNYEPTSDRVVHTAKSCFKCHEQGILERDDTVLQAVENPAAGFDSNTRAGVEDRFPTIDVMSSIYQDDIADFTSSLNDMGVAVGEEPTWALTLDYEAPFNQPRVGSMFDLRGEVFEGIVQVNPALQAQYASLFNGSSNTLDFNILEGSALQTICDLSLGDNCNAADLATFEAGGVNFNVFCGEVRNGVFVGNAVPCPAGSTCNAEGECLAF